MTKLMRLEMRENSAVEMGKSTVHLLEDILKQPVILPKNHVSRAEHRFSFFSF